MLVKELRNLSGIGRVEKRGVYKLYVYKSNMHYIQACDYMQKINYCIQDLNEEIPNLQSFSNKNVVYIITLVTWIKEAVNALLELYQDTYLEKFVYSAEDELKKTDKYLTAIRSFVVAHPLKTNRHSKYGMDGKLTCIDIKPSGRYLSLISEKDIWHLDYDGLHESMRKDADFYLYAFSTKIEKKDISIHIGCNYKDIYNIAELYIDKIYALDKYLQKQKRHTLR